MEGQNNYGRQDSSLTPIDLLHKVVVMRSNCRMLSEPYVG